MTPISITPALAFLRSKNADDLTNRQLSVVMACKAGTSTVRGLANDLSLTKPVITRAADKLAKLGLLVRKPDPADGRSVFISLTKAGTRFAGNFV